MDSTSDTTGETQLVSQWTRPTDGVTKNISHLDDDNTMSLENRESLGPAVGAEDCDEGCRLNRENSEEILEEVYESSVTPGDENAESQAPWESSEPRDTRESLFQLLGDVDSLTRIHLAACTDDSETCGMKDEADANLEVVLDGRQADLELAAKIGQALVQKNEALLQELSMSRHRQEELEDNMKQLAHELGQKEDLLKQMSAEWREQEMVLLHPKFWNHVEDSENGSGRLRQQSSSPSICSEDVEALQEECKQLSVSNSELLEEGLDLRVQSLQVEKKESDLITQCVQKLADADDRIAWLIDVADQKAEEARKHDAEAKRLKDHLDELKSRSEDFVKSDHELHQELLSASQKELELQAQVTEWQNKYVECHEMLKVAQDEVRYWRGQNMMSGHMTMTNSGAIQPSGQPSLDDEIQHTIEHELFTESKPATSTPQKQLSDVARVMQTVKAANRNLNIEEISGTTDIDDDELAAPLVSFHDISLDSGVESEQHRATERTEVGVRSTSVSSQSIVAQTAVQPGRSSDTNLSGELASGFASEIRLRTIDRVQVYSAPEKLQIVKPLEGSRTLGKWQQLAATGSSGFGQSTLELPGIQVKQREQQRTSEVDVLGEETQTQQRGREKSSRGLGIALDPDNQLKGIARRVSVESPRREQPVALKNEETKVETDVDLTSTTSRPFGYLASLLSRPVGPFGSLLSRSQSIGLKRLLSASLPVKQSLAEGHDSEDSIE